MKDLNRGKQTLKEELLANNFFVSNAKFENLKLELIKIFRAYTKQEKFCINIDIAVLENGEYLVEVFAKLKDFA